MMNTAHWGRCKFRKANLDHGQDRVTVAERGELGVEFEKNIKVIDLIDPLLDQPSMNVVVTTLQIQEDARNMGQELLVGVEIASKRKC